MKITIDFETRSDIDLKTHGLAVYAEGKNTDIILLGVKVESEPARVWVSPNFRHLVESEISDEELEEIIENATEIEAHNLAFEKTIWDEIMHKLYGFKRIPVEKLRCSAAQAAALALPRALGEVGEALNLSIQKDKKGYVTMLRLCKPKKKGTLIWNDSKEDYKTLAEYCKIDCDAEKLLTDYLVPLSPKELQIWRLDQKINSKGVKIDRASVKHLISLVNEKEETLLNEVNRLTGGIIKSPRQIAASVKWLSARGIETETLDKEVVTDILKKEIPEEARRFLEIRQMLGKSSVTKLETMLDMACKDDRVRHTLLYHGCSTGRFSAKGLQIHNYPRDSFVENEVDEISKLDLNTIETLYDNIFNVASKCLRGMLIADQGRELLAGDYSAIEARITAWIAGQDNIVEAFRKAVDVYKLTASDIFGKNYEDVSKKERQTGKVATLSLGFQGWVAAFSAMAKNYGVVIPEEKAKEIITAWREANPKIVRFWSLIGNTAVNVIKTGNPIALGCIKLGMRKEPFKALHIRLPSGRLLTYFTPSVVLKTDKYGREKEIIAYMGVDSKSKKWSLQYTFGGCLTENVVQAIARDLLCEAMLRLDRAGYNIAFHVHDEIVCEEPIGKRNIKDYEAVMAEAPEWAEGLPISVEAWKGRRYRK